MTPCTIPFPRWMASSCNRWSLMRKASSSPRRFSSQLHALSLPMEQALATACTTPAAAMAYAKALSLKPVGGGVRGEDISFVYILMLEVRRSFVAESSTFSDKMTVTTRMTDLKLLKLSLPSPKGHKHHRRNWHEDCVLRNVPFFHLRKCRRGLYECYL